VIHGGDKSGGRRRSRAAGLRRLESGCQQRMQD